MCVNDERGHQHAEAEQRSIDPADRARNTRAARGWPASCPETCKPVSIIGREPYRRSTGASAAGASTRDRADQGRRTLAATEFVPERVHVADDDRDRAGDREPLPIEARLDADER